MNTNIVSERSRDQDHVLNHSSDDELLANTRLLVGRSNQIFAALLVHLAEVEARGLHCVRACSSLYTYCIYELRLSEDEAFRRVSAARLVKRFPALFGAIERGELHLTGLLLLGPHLTAENHVEVLARAKHRTKKEIARLVRQLDPLPDVPSKIVPLGPAPARNASATPSYEEFARSMNPVRELTPGERPADWTDDALTFDVLQSAAPANDTLQRDARQSGAQPPAPARNASPLTGPQRYRVQFTANEEYVALVERAKALLSHTVPNAGIDEIHLRAMRALVAELEKRKHAVKAAQPPTANAARHESNAAGPKSNETQHEPGETPPTARNMPSPTDNPRQRVRGVPAALRRAIFARDEARCTYVDPSSGLRCRETHHLELHHEVAYALGGAHSTSNLALRCRTHNTLAAEMDFGREFIADRKGALRHEAYVAQSTNSSA